MDELAAKRAAGEAAAILENPRFQDAFANVRENIVAQLENTPIGNDTARIELVVSLQVLKAIKQDLENDVKTALMNENPGRLP